MRIPAWRIALTGAAIVILALVGVSLVAAASNASAPAVTSAGAPAASQSTAATALANHPLLQRLLQRLADRPGVRRLVDGQLTYVDRDGTLITIELDHGTITAIGSNSLTLSEAGGRQVTVSTDGSTVVRLGGGAGKGTLSDLRMGDQVVVQSRLVNGSPLAKHVLRIPAATTAPVSQPQASPSTGA